VKILFSPYQKFIPIAKMLHAQGHELVSSHPGLTKNFNDLDIPSKPLSDFIKPDDKINALNYSSAALGKMIDQSYDGYVNFSDKVKLFMTNNIPAFMYSRLADLSIAVTAINNYDPDIILVHNDVEPITRTMAAWASGNGKPCLHIPHAVYMDVGRGAPGTDVHDIITASHLACAGKYQREWYEERGFVPDNIREVGIPWLDSFAKVVPTRDNAIRLLGLRPNLPVITYASSWRQDTNLLGCHDGVEEYYGKILEAMQFMPGAQLIVKVHPHGNNADWHMVQAKDKGVNCIVTATHLEVILQATDLLISYGPSNIIFEGSFFPGVRLAVSHGYEQDKEIIKIGENAASIQVAETIKNALGAESQNYTGFRYKYCGITDGKSAKRVVGFVEELLS